MRTWFTGGFIPPSTPVAPSYYGEVPAQLWPISALWAEPEAQAFVLAEDAAPEPEALDARVGFDPSEEFDGAREGYVFKMDQYGVGCASQP